MFWYPFARNGWDAVNTLVAQIHLYLRILLMHCDYYQNQLGWNTFASEQKNLQLQQRRRIWRDEDTNFGPEVSHGKSFGNHGKHGPIFMEAWGMDSAVVFLPWATINKTSIHKISIEPGHCLGVTWKRWPFIGGREGHFHRNHTMWTS